VRILQRAVSFIDLLKVLLGFVSERGIRLKPVRVPYANEIFIGLPNIRPRGIRGNA
jgi:hypothetical protein